MNLELVKINPHNRLNILCSYCDLFKHESETYADLDQPFRYICRNCAGQMMLRDGKNIAIIKGKL